jgi:hypothetical protein
MLPFPTLRSATLLSKMIALLEFLQLPFEVHRLKIIGDRG